MCCQYTQQAYQILNCLRRDDWNVPGALCSLGKLLVTACVTILQYSSCRNHVHSVQQLGQPVDLRNTGGKRELKSAPIHNNLHFYPLASTFLHVRVTASWKAVLTELFLNSY
jgi:hypothetical protein